MERNVRKILIVDTALNGCGVALYDGVEDRLIFDAFEAVARGQSERLVPMIEAQLSGAGLSYSDIDLVCGITGPGSFAGIRVGLSVVRSLALSMNMQAVGVSSVDAVMLEAMAGEDRKLVVDGHPLYVILESKRSDYYVERYVYDGSTSEIVGTITGCVECDDLMGMIGAEVKQPILRGDGVSRYLDDKAIVFNRLDLLCVGRHVLGCVAGGERGCVSQASPTYFRGADVSKSKKKYRMVEKLL